MLVGEDKKFENNFLRQSDIIIIERSLDTRLMQCYAMQGRVLKIKMMADFVLFCSAMMQIA